MTDILTVTMNPCLDISTETERVEPSHKLRCEAPRFEAGGGGINVARVVHRLGTSCTALFTQGGARGAELLKLLQAEGVPVIPVPIAGETRESFHVRDRAAQQEYRFVMPGPTLVESEWQTCLDHLEGMRSLPGFLVLSGSLPPGVPTDFYARLARLCRTRGSRCVLDTGGPALAAALKEGVYLIKPSLRELRDLTGLPLEGVSQWRQAAQQLVARGQAEVVVLSMGGDGALMAWAEGATFTPALPVTVHTTVGAGDSLVGGMMQALATGAGLREAFAQGVAAASAALMSCGTGLCQPADVARLRRELVLRDL